MLTCLAAIGIASRVQAAESRIVIPPATLDIALTMLARATGTDIISTEGGLRQIPTPALSGAMPAATALARLLKGSGYRAVRIDDRSFRIVRAPPARPAPRRPVRAVAAAIQDDIVVTASKQRIPLLRYPGSLTVIEPTRIPGSAGAPDMTDVARATPVLQNTELGPGRNKIFIRGVADSSFNGATQSTASVYFGDVQLGFSGPDASVKLYDMQSVEVMEGPQGTLYGSGSIGGIVRLTPNPVDLTRAGAALSGGITATVGGTPGFDVGGMIDLPVVADTVGLRIVGYDEREGGYIDDRARRAIDSNRVDTAGGRATLRIDPGDDWRVDVQGLYQRIAGSDGQYAERRDGPLGQGAMIAQPFHDIVGLGSIVVTKNWSSGLQLLSATGVASYHAADLFDATSLYPAARTSIGYETDGAKLLETHETRLSRSLDGGGSWVVGFTVLRNRDTESRSLGPLGNPTDIIGVTNVTKSASVFGETTIGATRTLALTLGSRLTFARTDGEPSSRPRSNDFVKGRSTRRVDPTAALSWKIGPRLAVFARVQSGYRTGGLAVARGIGRVADFRSDSILVGEMGLRRLRAGETGLSLTAALSIAHWRDIQADVIDRRGLPYTANIGNADIRAAEGTADWVPVRGLHAAAAFLYTDNAVTGMLADLSRPANRRLPEAPSFSAHADLGYEWAAGRDTMLSFGGSASYVGRSLLGTGDLFDISQGHYASIGVRGGWRRGKLGLTLAADNLTDSHANRFAFGNPFALAARDQATPLRPFNVRLGATVAW